MKPLKTTIFILLIIVVSCTKKMQTNNSRNDSVEKYLKLASNNALPFDLRKKYNKKAFSFIDLERNDTATRWYLGEISLNFSILKDSLNYYKISNLHLKRAIEKKDTLNLARFYRYRAGYNKNNTNYKDSSLHFYLKAEKIAKKINNGYILAKIYMNKGELQYRISDYTGAEYSVLMAYNFFRDNNYISDAYICLNDLGNINHTMKNYGIAIGYHKDALMLIKGNKINLSDEVSDIGTTLNNIGNSYRESKDYNNAIYYFKKALVDKKELKKDSELKGFLLNNLGYCYLNQNKFGQLPFLFEEAARVFDSLGIKNEGAISRLYLSNYYAKTKDTTKAIQYAEKALQLAKESKNNYYHLYALSNAGSVNKKKAPIYIKEYHRLNDSLMFEERKARNQFFKIQLETDEITQEKEKAIKQKWVQTSIIATILIIVILLFIIFKQRMQKKEFVLIQNQQKVSEEIYQLMLNQQSKEEEAKQKEKKRIALELHDNVMNKLASTRFNLFTLTQKNDQKTLESAIIFIDKIKEVEDEIRNLTHDFSKEAFTETNSFTTLLKQLIEQQNQLDMTDFSLQLDKKINWENIGSEIKMNLYRIIQEAVHNINKHAKANKADIKINLKENQLQLSISDNGIGFQSNETKNGIGLQNMHQRMAGINGKISVQSSSEKGTVISCTVNI